MSRLIHVYALLCSGLLSGAVGAETFKCTDGKQITYANMPCEEIALKPAGTVKSLVTIVPAAPLAGTSVNGAGNEESSQPQPDSRTSSEDSSGANKPLPPL